MSCQRKGGTSQIFYTEQILKLNQLLSTLDLDFSTDISARSVDIVPKILLHKDLKALLSLLGHFTIVLDQSPSHGFISLQQLLKWNSSRRKTVLEYILNNSFLTCFFISHTFHTSTVALRLMMSFVFKNLWNCAFFRHMYLVKDMFNAIDFGTCCEIQACWFEIGPPGCIWLCHSRSPKGQRRGWWGGGRWEWVGGEGGWGREGKTWNLKRYSSFTFVYSATECKLLLFHFQLSGSNLLKFRKCQRFSKDVTLNKRT